MMVGLISEMLRHEQIGKFKQKTNVPYEVHCILYDKDVGFMKWWESNTTLYI